jgi:hypothetical protein
MRSRDMARIALGLADAFKHKPRSAKRKGEATPQVDNRGDAMPFAPPPPKYTAETWASTCIMREARCHHCDQCAWEQDVARLFDVRNTYELELRGLPVVEHPTHFRNLDAALLALFEQHRDGPSAMGPMMDRLETGMTHGQAGTNYDPSREDPVLRKATLVVEVRRAVEHAFEGNALGLQAAECIAMLRARVGRAATKLPTYDELALLHQGLTAGNIRGVVKLGRRRITVELAARGVIPMPGANAGLHHDIDVRRTALEARS